MAVSSQQQIRPAEPAGLLALALGISAAVTRGGELRAMLSGCAAEFVRYLTAVERACIWVQSGEVLETCGDSDHEGVAATPDAAPVSFPLVVERRTVGMLGLFTRSPLRSRVLAAIEPMATVIAQAIERKRVDSELHAALRLHDAVENRLGVIADAAGALLEPLELQPILERVVGLAHRVMAADAYAVWRVDAAGDWRMLLSTGLSEGYDQGRFIGASATRKMPAGPVIAEDVDALPMLQDRRELYHAEGIRSFIAFPLMMHGSSGGSLTLYFRTPQRFLPEQVRVGSAMANLAAAAIASAEAFEDQRRLREEAQEQTRRITFIAEASKLLATTLDYEHTLRAVAALAIPCFADWCAVDIRGEDGQIRRLATVHADPARLAIAEEYHRRYPSGPDDPGGVSVVIRTNTPVMASEIPDDLLAATIHDPQQLAMLRELGLKSVIIAPMAARDRVLGAITFVTAESDRRYGPEDLAAAEHVARRAALAIDNALLFRAAQERHAEANRALVALAASHDRLQQFAYAASHDLREPLRTITAYLQLVERALGDRLDASTAEHFRFVTAGAARIRQLLDDLLDYVRLGDSAAQHRVFSLQTAAARAVENLAIIIEESGAQVSIGSLPEVVGDEARFVRLFQNLISNAIKYRGKEPPLINIRAERRDSMWAIAVQDNGVGIPKEHHQRIFGVFKRLHGPDVPGTGIGLAIAQAVVESHGGTLWVESEAGQGATFWFTAPVVPGE
ncbi:MAG TPA: ATP-binding protein [Bryobacteraceae bacterium]|nr:ATP-binding protein [Bryobacteraceae bacterium]